MDNEEYNFDEEIFISSIVCFIEIVIVLSSVLWIFS